MKLLVAVDMQNDFVDGALGTKEAREMIARAAEKIRNFEGMVVYTSDTHEDDYLTTQEGQNLPVLHCVRGTPGWEQYPVILEALKARGASGFEKPTFGSRALAEWASTLSDLEEIVLIGICTDICVISNALLLKAFLPEIPIMVDAACCAGVTPEAHQNALAAMRQCQIQILHV